MSGGRVIPGVDGEGERRRPLPPSSGERPGPLCSTWNASAAEAEKGSFTQSGFLNTLLGCALGQDLDPMSQDKASGLKNRTHLV